MAKKDDFTFKVEDFFGSVKESDHHDWTKAVLRITWGDSPTTVDIRNVNMGQNRMGKGISLTNEEVDKLVDILLPYDYGTLSALEDALAKRKNLFMIQDAIENMFDEEENEDKSELDGPFYVKLGSDD